MCSLNPLVSLALARWGSRTHPCACLTTRRLDGRNTCSPGQIRWWYLHRVHPRLHVNKLVNLLHIDHSNHRRTDSSERAWRIPLLRAGYAAQTGGRLTGTTLSKYMEIFTVKFLRHKAKFRLEIISDAMRRAPGWLNRRTSEEILTFLQIILSNGVWVLSVIIAM